jgi:amino acid transporter
VVVAYFGWKVFKKTKILPLDEIPLRAALEEIKRTPEERLPEAKG